MTDEKTAVRIRGLVVEADRVRLLGPVDLDVAEGEHVLLVGASGSGKSTLLRVVAGLLHPATGTIELAGRTVSDGPRLVVPPEGRDVGMLFQGGALWPHMTVERTLRFTLKHGGYGGDTDARVHELVAQCRLTGLEDRLPGKLSGGEKQRLGLARAIACHPSLLLLDEPLGPLDAGLRDELLGLLADLHAVHGWTTIHVTHDPGEVGWIASRTLRMTDGLLNTPDEVTP